MDNEMIAGIVTTILLILGVAAPGVLGYILKAAMFSKEAGELLTTAGIALEDKKVTAKEITDILKEAKDLKDLNWKAGSQSDTIKKLKLENKRLKVRLKRTNTNQAEPKPLSGVRRT